MSSVLSIINWTPALVTPVLNGAELRQLDTSTPRDFYYPDSLDVERVTGMPAGGQWGDNNTLVLRSSGSSKSQVYNSLGDPGKPNIGLQVWILPEFCVFSQLGEKLVAIWPNEGS